MSKKVYKRVSFIVPELNQYGGGEISEKIYEKLLKYSKLPIYSFEIMYGIKMYVNNEIQINDEIEMDDTTVNIGDIIFDIGGLIGVKNLVEGDRIDIDIPFETGITVEDKVASSFEGLSQGDVGFKLYRDGDVVATVTQESNFSKTFISVVKKGTDEGHLNNLSGDNDEQLYSHIGGIFDLSCYDGALYIDSTLIEYVGDITLWGAYDGYLIEVVVK